MAKTEEEKREAHKLAMKKYYEKNKAKLKEYATQYKADHPDSVKESNSRYWAANSETINAKRRKTTKRETMENQDSES